MVKTPLYSALEKYIQSDYSRFHMPGHKGSIIEPFGSLTAWDVTELKETDSLFECEGSLKELEDLYTKLYGTKRTIISAGGSTLCIQTMLKLVSERGKKILASRNIHNSAVNAIGLLGLDPIWIYPNRESEPLIGRIEPSSIKYELERQRDVCAVYITSPDYFGVMSDIKSIADVCHSFGVPLLVDNAHGSHLKFIQDTSGASLHPMDLGADLCCDSLHKTLPALTGASLLHCNNETFCENLKDAMTVFASTSPNYLIMLSIDTVASFLLENGALKLRETVKYCSEIKTFLQDKGFLVPEYCDPMRITITLSGSGYSANTFKKLLEKHSIMEEFLSDSGCVFLASPYNRDEDFSRFRNLIADSVVKPCAITTFPILHLPKKVDLRTAILSPHKTLPIENAVNKIAAQVKSPCPPGIPLVMPGELLQDDCIQTLKSYGIYTINVLK